MRLLFLLLLMMWSSCSQRLWCRVCARICVGEGQVAWILEGEKNEWWNEWSVWPLNHANALSVSKDAFALCMSLFRLPRLPPVRFGATRRSPSALAKSTSLAAAPLDAITALVLRNYQSDSPRTAQQDGHDVQAHASNPATPLFSSAPSCDSEQAICCTRCCFLRIPQCASYS